MLMSCVFQDFCDFSIGPPTKNPGSTPEHNLAMLHLALASRLFQIWLISLIYAQPQLASMYWGGFCST